MLSTLFRKDYDALTARGVKFGLADVIRLNALALKAKEAAMPTFGVPPRRAVFLKGFVLREPTIAHEIWIENAARHFDAGNERISRMFYAYALSREAFDLPDALNGPKCVKKVFSFARRRLASMTMDALGDALNYALFGADWTAAEVAPAPKGEADGGSPVIGILNGMRARRLPVSLDDAKGMTAAEILDATLRADVRDERYDANAAHTAAVKDYYRALAEVRDRGKGGSAE